MKRVLAPLLFVCLLTCQLSAATWTTTITDRSITDGELRVVVLFNNNVTKPFDRTYRFKITSDASAQLINQVRAEIEIQNALESSIAKIATGTLAIPAVTIDPPDLALVAFQLAMRTYRQTKVALDLGLVQQKALDDALADLKAKYKPEYLSLLSL